MINLGPFKSRKRKAIEAICELDSCADANSAAKLYDAIKFNFEVAHKLGYRGKSAAVEACKATMDAILVADTSYQLGRGGVCLEKWTVFLDLKTTGLFEVQMLTYRLARGIEKRVPNEELPKKFNLSLERFGKLSIFPLEKGGTLEEFFASRL